MVVHHLKRATRIFFFYLLIVVAIGFSLVRLFPFAIETYKTDLERKIYDLTSIPVKIGRLKANLRGINPEVILNDIQVLATDKQEGPPIKLEQVRVGIDLTQLLITHRLLPSSWLTLVGAKLSMVRHVDGSLSIVGLNSDSSEKPLWLLSGGRYEVLKSEITWLDLQQKKPAITFNNVDLLVRNHSDSISHDVHLLTQLPEQYGKKLRVSMSVQGNVFATENLNGWVYVEGDTIDLSEIFTEQLALGIKITNFDKTKKNESSFKLWSEWNKSSLRSLSGNIQIKNSLLTHNNKNFVIKQLDTEFETNFKAGWLLGVKDFALATRDHRWPAMNFSFSANEPLKQFAASGTQIELDAMAELVDFFVPINKKNINTHKLIADLGLKGQLKDFSFFSDEETQSYAVNGDFKHVFVNAVASLGLPQIKNLTGVIKGSNEKGIISLSSNDGSLFFPKLFRKAFALKNLSGEVEWQQQADNWLIKSESLTLETPDFEAKSNITLSLPKNEDAAFMDLQTSFGNMQDVGSLVKYYPVAIMKKKLIAWLDAAFVSGQIKTGGLLIHGKLDQFPFAEGQGVFEVEFQASNAEINFSPDWPNLKKVDGKILFTKRSLAVDIAKGFSENLEITAASVKIPSFIDNPSIHIQGSGKGSIVDGLKYLQQTTLHKPVDKVLDVITPSGITKFKLEMDFPLTEKTEFKLDAETFFKEASFNINAVDLNVTGVEGVLKFSEKELFSDGLKAEALGHPIAINMVSKDQKTVVGVEGKTDFLQLKNQFSFLQTELVADEDVKGLFAYTATMNVAEGDKNNLAIKTDLLGVEFDFPGSLKKSAEQEKPLLLTLPLNESALLPININYNDELKAAFLFDKKQNSIHSVHIVYGEGKAELFDLEGMIVHIDQDQFDVSEWSGFFKPLSEKDLTLQLEQKEESGLELNMVTLKTRDIKWQEQGYGKFEMILQDLGEQWQGKILSSFAKGDFVFPLDALGEQAGNEKIKLAMEYLDLTQLMAFKLPIDDSKKTTSPKMPLIDVVSQKLLWQSKNLGRLDMATEKMTGGIRFKYLNLFSKGYKAIFKGDWQETIEGGVTNLHGSIRGKNIGKTLTQFNLTDDIKETEGTLDILAKWQGLPFQFVISKVEADLKLNLKEGRISSIEPGVGRLLGVLAMGQWIKRLSLNFGDLYKKGLSFDTITGDFILKGGILSTKNLWVDAVPANISITGDVDLVNKTLENTVQVVPKSSGAIPIAGPIVEGIAGAITQAFDKDYKDGYYFGSEYQISGKWSDIKVIPLRDKGGVFTKLTDFSWVKEDQKSKPKRKTKKKRGK